MNRDQARALIVAHFGGVEVTPGVWRFRTAEQADDAKAVLDHFDPAMTGEVFFDNRLMLAKNLAGIHG